MKKLWKGNSFLKKEGEKELIFDLEPENERRKSSEKQYIACKYCGRKNLTQKCILLQCEPLKIIGETDKTSMKKQPTINNEDWQSLSENEKIWKYFERDHS